MAGASIRTPPPCGPKQRSLAAYQVRRSLAIFGCLIFTRGAHSAWIATEGLSAASTRRCTPLTNQAKAPPRPRPRSQPPAARRQSTRPASPLPSIPIDALWLVGAVRGKVAGGFQSTKQDADRWQAPCPFLPGPPCPAFRVEPASVKPTCDGANPPCGHNKMPSLRRAVAARGACRRW